MQIIPSFLVDKASCTRQFESELSLHSLASLFPIKEGIFRKPTRPSLPLRKAPPLISVFSPQGRRGKPPYSVLGTATLLGWRTIKGLRQVLWDGTAWGRLAHQCCCSSLGWLIFIKGRKVVGICGITDYADFDLCGLG